MYYGVDADAENPATAQNIQMVSASVIRAVEELAKEAAKMLEFMDDTVSDGYSKLVETGESYRTAADNINKMMVEFTHTAKALEKNMDQIKDSSGNINITVEECAFGVANIATRSSELAGATSDMQKISGENTDIANLLIEEVSKFKLS